MELKEYTHDQLIAEITRRKLKPELLEHPDYDKLQSLVKAHIDSIADGSYHCDNDDSTYISEAAIEACYGDGVFNWINANTD